MADKHGTAWLTHLFAWIFAVTVFVFNYAVLVETGQVKFAAGGFIMGLTLLFFLYGQSIDRFYLHIGDKIKIGGDAFDPERERVTIAYDDERRE